jgi:hypothetical protein
MVRFVVGYDQYFFLLTYLIYASHSVAGSSILSVGNLYDHGVCFDFGVRLLNLNSFIEGVF